MNSYVSIPTDRTASCASASEVVYQLTTLAAEMPGARVLVMGQGREARRVVQDAVELGFVVCVPVTADKKLDSPVKYASDQVLLGDRYSDALMANAFAVLHAAKGYRAEALFLCGEARALAQVDEFLARAQREGMLVFRAVDAGARVLGWALCETASSVPSDETWVTCPHCNLAFSRAAVRKNLHICPQCGGYFRMASLQRLSAVLDQDTFEEWDACMEASDPLSFPGYAEKVDALRRKTGLDEAVRTGSGLIAGMRCAIAVMDAGFLMGSMGANVGEKLCRMVDRATAERLPVVVFCASGGARMQEGLVSLMQMAKVSCALERHGREGLFYVSVLTDPTTGGVTASFAMQGDVVLAEPRALIGFAGQRVIRDTIKQELPEGFQTAEFALEHGLIDAVVPRERLRAVLGHLLALHHGAKSSSDAAVRMLPSYQSVCAALNTGGSAFNRVVLGDLLLFDENGEATPAPPSREGKPSLLSLIKRTVGSQAVAERRVRKALERREFGGAAAGVWADAGEAPQAAGAKAAHGEREGAARTQASAWESVQLARNTHRPTALRYIEGMLEGFIELHGDRSFGDDAAIVAGIGWLGGQPVTVIAQEKGADLQERIRRNFGCPQPEGYRKALRLMRQAEKFGRPVICLVDTQGAFCGTQAEERGQGNALADNLLALAGLRVPVVSVLLGEGGSGGALALALANRVAMQQHAVYSVLSPEGFASILWKDRSRAAEAASVMRMDADSVHAMGIVDDVLSEGPRPAHENPAAAVAEVRGYVVRTLQELSALSPDELVDQRHQRFSRF